jgi:hypothetical protein
MVVTNRSRLGARDFFVGLVSLVVYKNTDTIGCFNLGIGIFFYLSSFLLSFSKDKKYWSAVLLRTAIPLFFFGVVFTTVVNLWGFFIIASGLIILYLGINYAPE